MNDSVGRDGPVASSEPLLAASSVSKAFGGLRAVDSCTFTAEQGKITGLIGPNGAGKSTLLGLLSGMMRPDAGTIRFAGHDVTRWPVWRRARAGLIHTFQVSRPLGHMTVVENMLIGAMDRRGENFTEALLRRRKWKMAEAESLAFAESLLRRFNLLHVANDYAETLSGGQLRLLEFARALMSRPRLLLLDEPFAGVHPRLAEELADHVHSLNSEGFSFVLIEHELTLVRRLCNPVIVMNAGNVLAEGSMEEISKDHSVVQAYLGRAAEAAARERI